MVGIHYSSHNANYVAEIEARGYAYRSASLTIAATCVGTAESESRPYAKSTRKHSEAHQDAPVRPTRTILVRVHERRGYLSDDPR